MVVQTVLQSALSFHELEIQKVFPADDQSYFIHSKSTLAPTYTIDAQRIEVELIDQISISANDRVCITNEAQLQAVYEKMEEGPRKRAIDILKNKFLFRKALASMFPDFHFQQTTLEELQPVPRKSVLKPVKGFFSTGVRVLNPGDDLDRLKEDISREMKANSSFFSESVLSTEEWLVEEFIGGEEIAVDLFYGADGTPVIVNITQHPMPSDLHYLNVVYWTSKALFQRLKKPLESFFESLNKDLLQVTNFPLHAEFKIDGDALVPIEINPLRFGGFGLADLAYHAFKFNPYEMFFHNEAPDWDRIWQESEKEYYCWALAYNGKDIDVQKSSPDHQAFTQFCGGPKQILSYREMDYRKQPVFAIVYLQLETDEVIQALLSADFNRFFRSSNRLVATKPGITRG